ncbi:hypothetical protein HK102_010066, partial [Quaeritorhiza haematococci]
MSFRSFKLLLYALPPTILFFKYGYTFGAVSGRSMQPTFNPNTSPSRRDIVLLDRFSIARGRYTVGDVVFLSAPHDPDLMLIKRIVAVEGDLVQPREKFYQLQHQHQVQQRERE